MKSQKLSDWLKLAEPMQRYDLAVNAGTSVAYLYHIAGGHTGNISLKLALAIERETTVINIKTPRLPIVTIHDLNKKDSDNGQ